MICCPEPVVLEIRSVRALGNVHVGMRSHTLLIDGSDSGRALSNLQIGTFGTSDTGVNIPDTGATVAVEVVLDDNSSWSGTLGLHNHIRPFDVTALAGFANLHDGYRAVFVAERGT